MLQKEVVYPQYRKYPNNKSYFKILSPNAFEEIQVLGEKKTFHFFKAEILPDKNYILDLVFNYVPYWVVCDAIEYEKLRLEVKG